MFRDFLKKEEKSEETQEAYLRYVRQMKEQEGYRMDQTWYIDYRNFLKEQYGSESVNVHIAALNQYLKFCGEDWSLGYVKVQQRIYRKEEEELTLEEYERMLQAVKKNRKMYFLLQTVCSTGIRVSELQYITVESLQEGSVHIYNKGKYREVLLPELLVQRLYEYCRYNHIEEGEIFITRTGNALNRSNIWRAMKGIARKAGIPEEKVYPHNLRHLFARTYYEKNKDLVKLADLLGHSSQETTRYYLITTGKEQRDQINSLNLVK